MCKYCGEHITRQRPQCDCLGTKAEREAQEVIKEKERFERSTQLKYDHEIAAEMVMLQSDDYSRDNGYFTEWNEFFEEWFDNHQETDEKPKYVWGTVATTLSLDASDLIENACEYLHEEAFYSIPGKDLDAFQIFIDEWCKNQPATKTYFPSQKYAVIIPWEIYSR